MNVKIELQKGETPEQAEELILKAFNAQRDGTLHSGRFHDSAIQHLVDQLQELHGAEFQSMLREIFEELDKEYQDDGNI